MPSDSSRARGSTGISCASSFRSFSTAMSASPSSALPWLPSIGESGVCTMGSSHTGIPFPPWCTALYLRFVRCSSSRCQLLVPCRIVGLTVIIVIIIRSTPRYVMITHHSLYARIYKRQWIACMLLFCWLFSYGMQLPTLLNVWGKKRRLYTKTTEYLLPLLLVLIEGVNRIIYN